MTPPSPALVERAAEDAVRSAMSRIMHLNVSPGVAREIASAALCAIPEAANGERESVAAWMLEHSYPTGHGDTVADLLVELVGHEREACWKIARSLVRTPPWAEGELNWTAQCIAEQISARSTEQKGDRHD